MTEVTAVERAGREAPGELRFQCSLDGGTEEAMPVPGKRAGLAEGTQRPDARRSGHRGSWKAVVQAEPREGPGFSSQGGVTTGSFCAEES